MKIISYKKIKLSQYELLLDNNDKVVLYEDVILNANLLIKHEITISELNKLISENEKYEVYNKCLKYIEKRLRSEKEIKEKFKDYSSDSIDFAINKLKKDGYLDRETYIKSFINDQINLKISGPNKIIRELKQLGFMEEEISNHLSIIDDKVWQEKVSKLIEKGIKSNHKKSNKELLLKITNDLINRGFYYEQIEKEISKVSLQDDLELLKKEFEKLYKKYQTKYHDKELLNTIIKKLYIKGYQKEDIMTLWQEKN